MEFSKQQSDALIKVDKWLKDKKSKQQVFRLFGFAGTGKTTLAIEISKMVKGRVVFGAFTGKAAMVMKTKGCINAQTIHSMIYRCETRFNSEPVFILNEESAVKEAALVIVDECSMLGQDLGSDLLSFGTKILVLGDPAQLPPIKGTGFFDTNKPDVMLTDIHRQALDNPIIQMSLNIRTGKGVKPGKYGESKVILKKDVEQDEVIKCDQVLCGLNKTRSKFNRRMRELLDFTNPALPEINDKIICLRNNRERGLLNGGMWDVLECGTDGSIVEMEIKSRDIKDLITDVKVPIEFFAEVPSVISWEDRKEYDEFDFGYAITVHKSQGSQWNHIMVFNENQSFRNIGSSWLYTAVTRAAEKLTLVI
jgi:exodeoxyribonuclease-5